MSSKHKGPKPTGSTLQKNVSDFDHSMVQITFVTFPFLSDPGKGRLCSQKWMNFRSIFVSVMVPKMQRNIFLVWMQIEAHWSSSSHWHNRRPVEPPPPQHRRLHLLLQLLHPLLLHFHQLEHFTNFNILCQIFWDVYAVWFPHLWMFESQVLCVLSGGRLM